MPIPQSLGEDFLMYIAFFGLGVCFCSIYHDITTIRKLEREAKEAHEAMIDWDAAYAAKYPQATPLPKLLSPEEIEQRYPSVDASPAGSYPLQSPRNSTTEKDPDPNGTHEIS
jgi:hypothetical protein